MQEAPQPVDLQFSALSPAASANYSEAPTNSQTAEAASPQSNAMLGCAVWLLPILILCSLIALRRYQLHRLRRQIEVLEKSWLLKSTHTPF